MDLVRIGNYLKELRKEKGLSQEELAEKFYVSRRTVSRWETGSNMPDIDILIELADFYNIDLREILDGKRRNGLMNNEIKDTALKIAEYENEDKKKLRKRTLIFFILGIIANIITVILEESDLPETFLSGFIKGIFFGLSLCAMVIGILYITGTLNKLYCKMAKCKKNK